MSSLLASAHHTASPPALICHEAQSPQQRCGLRLRPAQFPVYAYVLSFTLLLLSKRQHSVRVVDYSLPGRDSHPARGTKLRLAHMMANKFVTGSFCQPGVERSVCPGRPRQGTGPRISGQDKKRSGAAAKESSSREPPSGERRLCGSRRSSFKGNRPAQSPRREKGGRCATEPVLLTFSWRSWKCADQTRTRELKPSFDDTVWFGACSD